MNVNLNPSTVTRFALLGLFLAALTTVSSTARAQSLNQAKQGINRKYSATKFLPGVATYDLALKYSYRLRTQLDLDAGNNHTPANNGVVGYQTPYGKRYLAWAGANWVNPFVGNTPSSGGSARPGGKPTVPPPPKWPPKRPKFKF